MPSLQIENLGPSDLCSQTRSQMFELFARSYDNSDRLRFEADLNAKTAAFVMRDPSRVVRGFSTLDLSVQAISEQTYHVLFSGDTIIDPGFWGRNDFALRWIEWAGIYAASRPDIPLVWFLIVKGHRTFRYMPTFARSFFPSPDSPVPARAKELRDHLARQRFGDDYDPETGVVTYTEPRDFLSSDLAFVSESQKRRRDVDFFLKMNPGYHRGNELACLCHLTPHNLKPIAARAYLRGVRQAGRAESDLTKARPW